MKFIGRQEELKRLKHIINKDSQENVLIYGRRRIGKSFLIKKALESYEGIVINYQCMEKNVVDTLSDLTSIIREKFNIEYNITFRNFEEILDFLFKSNKKVVLVLDEYPYLLKKIDGVSSIIQNKIDTYKFDSKLKLILSGSQIDIMLNIIKHDSPLYGRFSELIHLKEHDYYESSLYYPNYNNEEKLLLYSVFGGEPIYNSKIDQTKTPDENIIELMVKENSYCELMINSVLKTELGKIEYANDVIFAIASGLKKNDDIVKRSHVESTSKIAYILDALQSLDLIEKKFPINAEKNKKKTMYYVKSNALKFYYCYIFNNYNIRSVVEINEFYDTIIKPKLNEIYIPKIFEDVTKQYLIKLNKAKKLTPSFMKIGTYWYDDKQNKVNGQFDVVTNDSNGYIYYEVKYTNATIDDRVVREEKEQLQALNLKYYKLGFVSKTGFNISNPNDYILIGLNDIYGEMR